MSPGHRTRTSFALLRVGYGALMVAAPGPLVRHLAGAEPDHRARVVARVLGARHVVQGVLTVGRPGPAVLALGAEADLAHAATALGLAGLDRARRRGALIDAAVAGAYAAAGAVLASRHQAPALHPVGHGLVARLAEWRESLAARTARITVPALVRREVLGGP